MKSVITNHEAREYIAKHLPFRVGSGSLSARFDYSDGKEYGTYRVFSYATCIFEVAENGVEWVNDTRYSITTNRHQSIVTSAIHRDIQAGKTVHVIKVPRGEYDLTRHTGNVGHHRAARIACGLV